MCRVSSPARARASVAARVADRVHRRPRRRARRLVRIPRRLDLGDRRTRRRRQRSARSRTSAGTAATRSAKAPAPGAPSCDARSTAGRGTSRAACARSLRAATSDAIARRRARADPGPVDVWGRLVFVNLDPDAAPLAEYLEGVPADAAWADLDAFRCAVTTTTPVACNWKVVADGFSETYHVQGIHREMLGSLDDIHATQRLWDRHGVSYQDYAVPSPRLGRDVDRPGRLGLVRVHAGWAHGRRVRRAVPDASRSHAGQTIRDVIADRLRRRARAQPWRRLRGARHRADAAACRSTTCSRTRPCSCGERW